MLRVIAGSARNLKLQSLEGLDTRPTLDRIKETLFNILQAEMYGSVVADFFAGTGSLGIEALSRGATKAYFVDNSPAAIKVITENVKHTKFEDKSVILKEDATGSVFRIFEKHVDIVFMDPPYDKDLEKPLLKQLSTASFVDGETIVVVEASLNTSFDYVTDFGYTIYREKKYKTNKHVFMRLDK